MLDLLLSFLYVGFFSIGGGYATLPLIQEQIVELHHWLTYKEFTDIVTISQMTPGPLAVNGSTFVGLRVAGIPGAIAATFGCVITGILISLTLQSFFAKNKSELVELVLKALKPVSVGLIASAAMIILLLSWFGVSNWQEINSLPDLRAVVISLVSIAALRRFNLSPVWLMAACGAAGILVY